MVKDVFSSQKCGVYVPYVPFYLNVLQQLLLAPADVLQLLLFLWGEVVRHWGEKREKMRGQERVPKI